MDELIIASIYSGKTPDERAKRLGLFVEHCIKNKLNREKHGTITLSITSGKVKKISWQAGEVDPNY